MSIAPGLSTDMDLPIFGSKASHYKRGAIKCTIGKKNGTTSKRKNQLRVRRLKMVKQKKMAEIAENARDGKDREKAAVILQALIRKNICTQSNMCFIYEYMNFRLIRTPRL